MNKFHKLAKYHPNTKEQYFEGWYLKFYNDNILFIIIFGIFRSFKDKFSFIMFINKEHAFYYKYLYNEFQYTNNKFDIAIGPNMFTESNCCLDLNPSNVIIPSHEEVTNFTSILEKDMKKRNLNVSKIIMHNHRPKIKALINYHPNVLRHGTFSSIMGPFNIFSNIIRCNHEILSTNTSAYISYLEITEQNLIVKQIKELSTNIYMEKD
ncbi:3878_t:CDS:1 [Gigaspora margarita]|uniref:3878_t:CDS:1 n=1 Tax=Gigaspora margarita TaxID=4874 RepID=A0ABM8W0H8_GIGMA|nr:3878_t:CDS:1 [Gigaspora margarita]